MRVWNLPITSPWTITLAADARLSNTAYTVDQIWEFNPGGGEPPALALQTTYGLRARTVRQFWRFRMGDLVISDPVAFAAAPKLQTLFTNYMQMVFDPFAGVHVTAEYWVPGSLVISGRLQVENQGIETISLTLELAVSLVPSENGRRMNPVEMSAATVLAGQTSELYPVVFLTGGAKPGVGAYPSLVLNLEIGPYETYRLFWAQAACGSSEASFDLARATVGRAWDAEIARIELLNASQLEIHTGDPEWDLVLALGQQVAQGLILSPTSALQHASFVQTRRPDQGFSPRGDGNDYPVLWGGQSPLDAYQLFGQILPGGVALAKGIVRNFLATAGPNGFVDWKPGLGGQRSQLRATPVLATLAEQIFLTDGDRGFIEDIFPDLVAFLQGWFSEHDQDGDGIPEWAHMLQTSFDDHPLFSQWHTWSQGVQINTAESPDLCAYLYRECGAVTRMAEILARKESITALQAFSENVRSAVEASWDAAAASYRYWDRDAHHSDAARFLGERVGAGEVSVERAFENPARLLIRVENSVEQIRDITIFITGAGASGQHRVERINPDQISWFMQRGLVVGERTYSRVERVEIQGLAPEARARVYTAGYDLLDHTVLTPLWAGIPSSQRASALVGQTVLASEKFLAPFGLRASLPDLAGKDESVFLDAVHMLWNILAGEGLLAYGFRREAADLVMRLMKAVIGVWKREGCFRRWYQAETGRGKGERNALDGLPPLGLLMQTLGVQIQSPWSVKLSGFNPYPWPVTVKYRGLTVLCQSDKTTLIFPDGQTVLIDEPDPCRVSLE